MAKRPLLALIALIGLTLFAVPAAAQEASLQLRARANEVVALLRGQGDPAALFSADFLAQVPAAQVRAIGEQLRAQYGAVRSLGRIEPQSAIAGVIHVETERATLRISIALQPQPPNRIQGLLVTGADVRGDTLAAVMAELRALPGATSVAVARLGEGAPELLASIEPEAPLAIGSAFKLFILAELSRQVQAGQRHWSDVVPLDRPPQPAGALQNWPTGAPFTLHTLAGLMIAQSDNRATDVLLHVAGRENVERMMSTAGIAAAGRNRPLLGTAELFALKSADEVGLRAWLAADEGERRRLLATIYADPRADLSVFTGAPTRIDSLEWFASAADLVRTMDWLRRHGDDTARAILAINPGAGPAVRSDFVYFGYKGGSEPGVLNLTWLTRNRAGTWHVVTGSWNNPAAVLDEGQFFGLMARAVQLVR